jgi:SAM-dependent methyltransferase
MNTVERFSNRVANYVKYRPDYPREVVGFLSGHCGLTSNSVVADIGCGPGMSSRMFLENGCRVIGVEPNQAMREASREYLAEFPNFAAVDGSADATTLPDASVDLIVAAQAFHWFEPHATRNEFHRILRPGEWIVLIWNERQLDTTPFLIEYEALLVKYGRDYGSVRHENIGDRELSAFFQAEYGSATFEYVQVFDLDGIRGRMLSSSYMPNEDDPDYPALNEELTSLFANHAENGKIKVFYDTRVYFSHV